MQTRKILVCFLIVFLVFTFIPIPKVHATATFGNTDAQTGNASINGVIRGSTGTPADGDGKADSITAYINTYNSNRDIKCALYVSATNAYVGTTPSQVVKNNGYAWTTFNFDIKPDVTNGVEYKICAWTTGGADLGKSYVVAAGFSQTIALDGWPDPLVPVATDMHQSIYCTYTPSAGQTEYTFQGNFAPTFTLASTRIWNFTRQHSFTFSFGSSLNCFVGFNTISQFGLSFSLNQLRTWQFSSYTTIPFQLALNSIQNFAYTLPGLLTFYGDITATFTMKALKEAGFTTEQTIPFAFGIQSATTILQLGILTIWSSIGFTFQTLSSQYGLAEITLDYAFALAGLAFILAITGITITLVRRKGD